MQYTAFRLLSTFAAAASFTAMAAPITVAAGNNITIDFNGFYSDAQIAIPGLTGELALTNIAFNAATINSAAATRVTMNYTLTNTSVSPVTASRISNFSFDTSPNVISNAPNAVTGVFTQVHYSANQPNGIGTVEICYSDSNTCTGGAGNGVTLGQVGTGTLTLFFSGAINSFNIDQPILRYQAVSCAQGSPCNPSANGFPTSVSYDPPGSEIPEPSTYALIAAGLAAIAVGARRKKA